MRAPRLGVPTARRIVPLFQGRRARPGSAQQTESIIGPFAPTTKPRPRDVAATPMQLALTRGYRWLAILESGEAKSITEFSARENIDNSQGRSLPA